MNAIPGLERKGPMRGRGGGYAGRNRTKVPDVASHWNNPERHAVLAGYALSDAGLPVGPSELRRAAGPRLTAASAEAVIGYLVTRRLIDPALAAPAAPEAGRTRKERCRGHVRAYRRAWRRVTGGGA